VERFQGVSPATASPEDSAENVRFSPLIAAAGATLAVCVLSPGLTHLTGDDAWYPVPLFAALIALWWRLRMTRADVGLKRGRGFYGRATLLPLVVVGSVVWLATLVGATRVGETPIRLLGLQVTTMAFMTAMGTVVTEDGLFRGALWGALDRAGLSKDAILLWTASASVVWYIPIITMLPSPVGGAEAMLVRGLNLWLLALCWGVLRIVSGSVLVVAWSHGLWNGLAYTLFGFGAATGAMGVVDPLRFDPERGWAGVAINALALVFLCRWWRRHAASEADDAAEDAADDPAADAP